MKTIKIITLKLENFKCHEKLSLVFGGRDAAIFGDNGVGKTSVYDALTWLLFGRDSQGNGEKIAQIKPLDVRGQVRSHEAVTAVEAVLDVDGEGIALRREYREVWTARRGEMCYDGNVSAYFIQGVPVKYTAFREKIDEIVDEELFRMLTDVHYFAGELPWQKRREILTRVARVPEDRVLLAGEPAFAPLLECMGKLDLESCRRKLLAEKKGYVGARNELPTRIDECRRTVADLEMLDFAAAREALEGAKREKANLEADPAGAHAALGQLEAENRAYRAKRENLRWELQSAHDREKRARKQCEALKQILAGDRARLEENRERQREENRAVFSDICSACGQTLPADRLQEARERFDMRREEALRALAKEADRLTARQEADAGALRAQEEACQADAAQIAELTAKLDAMGEELPGYAMQKVEFEKCRFSSRDARLRQLEERIAEAMEILAKEDTLAYARARVAQLQAQETQAEEKLQQVERMLALMEQYLRYRAGLLEQSVNDAFHLATFRLFREQVSGGLEERCDVVVEGVPYPGLNAGAKVNVGIDILNTLGRVFGVRVPLFIDNAESVTRLEAGEMQVVRLVVSAGEGLRVAVSELS